MLDLDIDTPAGTRPPPAGDDLAERYRSMRGLVDAIADLRPLISSIRKPVVFKHLGAAAAIGQDHLQAILSSIFVALDLIAPVVRSTDDEELSLWDHIITERLEGAVADLPAAGLDGPLDFAGSLERLPAYVRQYVNEVYYHGVSVETLPALDGAPLTTFRSGGKKHTVVMVLPCATPFQIARSWFSFLSQHYNVVTWETRKVVSGDPEQSARGTYLELQSDDLQAVIQRYCPEPPHVMGICGGAVVALNAAQRPAVRLAGLSLWYGDYNFDDPSLQTDYQKNLRWMMETASAGRESAQLIYDLFNDKAMLKSLNKRYAASILCPYADVDDLWRYAVLNGAIMSADVAEIATRLPMPISVFSSENDQTAHPGGSKKLAALLANGRLHLEQEGDHLCFFGAEQHTTAIALACIQDSFAAREPAGQEAGYAV